jgi:hypothetical protein
MSLLYQIDRGFFAQKQFCSIFSAQAGSKGYVLHDLVRFNYWDKVWQGFFYFFGHSLKLGRSLAIVAF